MPASEDLKSALVKKDVELIKLLLEYNVTVTYEHLNIAELFNLDKEIIYLLNFKLDVATTTSAPLMFHREHTLSALALATTTAVSTSSSSLELDEPKAKKAKMNI